VGPYREGEDALSLAASPQLPAAVTGAKALIDETPLHLTACERARCPKVLACRRGSSEAQFELAKRGGVKRVARQPLAIDRCVNFRESTLGTIRLRDRDGAIEGHDRRWSHSH
jgi:hypothetical protein